MTEYNITGKINANDPEQIRPLLNAIQGVMRTDSFDLEAYALLVTQPGQPGFIVEWEAKRGNIDPDGPVLDIHCRECRTRVVTAYDELCDECRSKQ